MTRLHACCLLSLLWVACGDAEPSARRPADSDNAPSSDDDDDVAPEDDDAPIAMKDAGKLPSIDAGTKPAQDASQADAASVPPDGARLRDREEGRHRHLAHPRDRLQRRGLQSSWMAYARNNYMASIVAYSGGLTGLGEGTWVTPTTMTPDDSNVVSAMLCHGAPGRDVVIMDFAAGSAAMEADLKTKGGYSLDCNHGGGHMIAPNGQEAAWRFMQDHPYKTKPSPYIAAGIPSSFPKYCKVP